MEAPSGLQEAEETCQGASLKEGEWPKRADAWETELWLGLQDCTLQAGRALQHQAAWEVQEVLVALAALGA